MKKSNKIRTIKKAAYVAAELARANAIIRSQKAKIKELEAESDSFPLRLWMLLMDVLQDKNSFHYPDLQTMNLIDSQHNSQVKLDVKASDIICIVSEPKSRKKNIFINQADPNLKNKVKKYVLNNNELNFEKLCLFLDPLSHHLVTVSKSSIVNVIYYEKSNKDLLVLNQKINGMEKEEPIKLSRKIGMKNFIKVKNLYLEQISLQKRLFGYKKVNGINY